MAKGKDAPLPRCACPPPRQHRACDPRPGRTLGTPVPGFPRRAAASLRVPGALSLRARARAQGARCKYRVARWGALLRYPTALRGQHSRLHCAPISPAAGRTCPALHCGTDRRRASAGAIFIAERSAPRGVPAVPPKPPELRPPHPKAAAGALVVTFATAARFTRSHIPTPYQAQLVAASARFWRKIGAPRAVRSHPAHCACIARRAPPRTDGNQRAVSTTCRTGRAPFAFQMTNAEACRVAPRLRQYLASGVGFWCRMGTAPPPVLAENAQCLCSSLAPLCPRCWVPIVTLCVVAPDGRNFWRNAPHYPAQHAFNSPPDRWRDGPSVCDIIINAYRARFNAKCLPTAVFVTLHPSKGAVTRQESRASRNLASRLKLLTLCGLILTKAQHSCSSQPVQIW